MSSPISPGSAQTANMSQAYQEALQKAKQIAAKINPNAKRGLDEEKTEPEAKKVAVSSPQIYRGLEILTHTTVGVHSQLEILVPGAKVGLIIGKGGETIKYLQDKSGAKMIVVQEGPNNEGSKPLRITGETEKVEAAKELVCDLVGEQSKDDSQSGNSNSFSGGGGFNDNAEFKLIVPKHAVGLVIGKGGEMIRKIQAETNAKVIFHSLKDDTFSDRECSITGKPLQVDQARRQIQDLINSTINNQKNGGMAGGGRGGHGGGNRQHNQHHNQHQQYHQQQDFWNNRNNNSQLLEFSFTVPTNKAGIIIGKGGETIKSINQQSGAHCEVDKKCLTDPSNLVNGQPVEKTFIIKGSYESVESCKQLVCDKINTILDFTPINQAAINMMNAPYPITQNYNWATSYPQQQWAGVDSAAASAQGVGAAGGVDYSKQWADYYRSMGMVREAEMIEQNYLKGNAQGGAVAAQATAAATNSQVNGSASAAAQQADYSAQWAEYYRSIGKVKEAEAIEAQIKNKVSGGPNSAPGQGSNDSAAAAAYQQAYAAYYQGQYNYGQYGFGPNQAQQGQQPPGDSK